MATRRVFKTIAMQKLERRLGIDLEVYLPEAYKTKTQAQVAEYLGIDQSTLSRWMKDLEIDARFQGQKPSSQGAVA
jgi:transcriptional regulator with XRE-family HTH domain